MMSLPRVMQRMIEAPQRGGGQTASRPVCRGVPIAKGGASAPCICGGVCRPPILVLVRPAERRGRGPAHSSKMASGTTPRCGRRKRNLAAEYFGSRRRAPWQQDLTFECEARAARPLAIRIRLAVAAGGKTRIGKGFPSPKPPARPRAWARRIRRVGRIRATKRCMPLIACIAFTSATAMSLTKPLFCARCQLGKRPCALAARRGVRSIWHPCFLNHRLRIFARNARCDPGASGLSTVHCALHEPRKGGRVRRCLGVPVSVN